MPTKIANAYSWKYIGKSPILLVKKPPKMIARVKNHPEHTARSVYHQGLIKLLILA